MIANQYTRSIDNVHGMHYYGNWIGSAIHQTKPPCPPPPPPPPPPPQSILCKTGMDTAHNLSHFPFTTALYVWLQRKYVRCASTPGSNFRDISATNKHFSPNICIGKLHSILTYCQKIITSYRNIWEHHNRTPYVGRNEPDFPIA